MTQEMVLLVHSPAVVSPTPPPESEEDMSSDRERLLKVLAASTDPAASSAESSRSGLRKRKDAPNHYPFNRVRRHRGSREPMSVSALPGVDNFDDDTDATVSVADSADTITSSPESDAPSYSLDDISLPNTPRTTEHMLTNMPMEPQDTTSSLRLEKSTAQSLDPTNITVEDYKLDSMPVNTSMLVVDSHHHHHQNNNNNNNNNNSNNNNSHRSTTNPHSSVVSSVNTMTIHDEDGNHIHQGSSLITSHSPESSYNNTLASMSSGSSGQMKFALSGRAPRNASFRCEFCGKKYINRAPLVTHRWEHHPSWLFAVQFGLPRRQQVQMMEAAHVLLGMQQPEYLFAYESYLYPMHDITYTEDEHINDIDTSIQA